MTADALLLIMFGLVLGAACGWGARWRLDRKLEHHGVKIQEWDQPYDMATKRPVTFKDASGW